jgi:hypothetical protein
MTAASGTARTARPPPWDGPDSKLTTPAPVPRRPHHRAPARPPQGRLRRRPWRPGSARSLTRPAARHGHGSYQGTGDASHARPQAARTPAKPPLTRPRSFRDDTPRTEQAVTERVLANQVRAHAQVSRCHSGADRVVLLAEHRLDPLHPRGEPGCLPADRRGHRLGGVAGPPGRLARPVQRLVTWLAGYRAPGPAYPPVRLPECPPGRDREHIGCRRRRPGFGSCHRQRVSSPETGHGGRAAARTTAPRTGTSRRP